jgi:16S rRNA processing protein RimM
MSEAAPDLLVIGRITGPFGIKGWVKIHSYTEPMANLLGYGNCQFGREGVFQPLQLEEGRPHGKGLVARLRNVDDRNAAEALKGYEIVVPRAALPDLQGDEYYWHQLEGLTVSCKGELLGRVDQLLETGANDVLVVKPCEGSRDKRERLIPWLMESVVTAVDVKAGTIEVIWDLEF